VPAGNGNLRFTKEKKELVKNEKFEVDEPVKGKKKAAAVDKRKKGFFSLQRILTPWREREEKLVRELKQQRRRKDIIKKLRPEKTR